MTAGTVRERTGRRVSRRSGSGMLVRVAIALLVAGFALLDIGNADWTHAIGIGCRSDSSCSASARSCSPLSRASDRHPD